MFSLPVELVAWLLAHDYGPAVTAQHHLLHMP